MSTRTIVAALAIAVSLVLVAGCDGDDPENGTPVTPPASTPSSAAQGTAKAPAVQQPLDASSFVADPCKSLTEAQLKDFALGPGKPDDDPADKGQGCNWDNNEAQVDVEVVFNPELTNGLSHLYAQQESGWYDVWEPTDVDGYPAVFAGASEMKDKSVCDLSVGVSDNLFFRASVLGNQGDDSCVAAKNVASAVLATIKAGGA